MAGDGNSYTFRRSVSQRRTYQSCGYKWLLRYGQGLRQRQEPGRFMFGNVMQQTADEIVMAQGGLGPVEASASFEARWAEYETADCAWPKTKGWGWYRERGKALATLAAKELPARIKPNGICRVNEPIRFAIQGVEELAIPDLVTHVQRKTNGTWQDGPPVLSVVDYKTAAYAYEELAPELDEQLSDYQLGCESTDLVIEQLGLVVFVTTAVPQIQWLLVPARTPEQLAHHIARAVTIDRLIREGVFLQNPRECTNYGGCEFQPVCFPSQAHRREAELVRDPAKVRDEQDLALEWD